VSAFLVLVAEGASVVHVATHGGLDGVRPDRSGLACAVEDANGGDGFLSLFEILGMRVPVELVALAGCETARGELVRGEGILGLSSGFLFAGSRVVLASLWKVADRPTEELMVAFYRRLAAGRAACEALREAKLAWLARAGRADPFPWAAFVLVGDGEVVVTLRPRRPVAALALIVAGGLALCGAVLCWRRSVEATRALRE
jgi:CHAT domain-containing protein